MGAWKIDDADVAFRKLLQRYGVDERAIAADFAARASRL
jgi:hypothetical protein